MGLCEPHDGADSESCKLSVNEGVTHKANNMEQIIRNYLIVTGGYWAFTSDIGRFL